MYRVRIRTLTLVSAILAVAGGAFAARAAQAQTRCYFKDCVVFSDGSRFCEVKEVPCEPE